MVLNATLGSFSMLTVASIEKEGNFSPMPNIIVYLRLVRNELRLEFGFNFDLELCFDLSFAAQGAQIPRTSTDIRVTLNPRGRRSLTLTGARLSAARSVICLQRTQTRR